MEVYVIRHTQVDMPANLCYGQTDVPLAHTFEKEAQILQQKLPENIEMIYSSPLSRCLKLAQFFQKKVVSDENLMEMNFGDWEMKTWNEINQSEFGENWMNNFVHVATPNGENLLNLYRRTAAFLENLRQENHERVLLITHGGVIRCLWAYVLEIPLQNIFKMPVGFGEVFKLRLGTDKNMDNIQKTN